MNGPIRSTSFGKIVEPSALLIGRDDALVDKGAEAPKPCFSPVEMRTPTTASGLLLTGTGSTTLRTTFPLPSLLRSFCPTEDMDFSTTTVIQIYATYSSFWLKKGYKNKIKANFGV